MKLNDDLCDDLLWVKFFSHSSNIWNFIHFKNFFQLVTAIFHHFNWWTKQEKKSQNKFYPMSARNSWSFFFPLIVQTLNLKKDVLPFNGCSKLSPLNIDKIISILCLDYQQLLGKARPPSSRQDWRERWKSSLKHTSRLFTTNFLWLCKL